MRLPTKLKMLIGLGLAMTGGKSLAQKQADQPMHKVITVDGQKVKLGPEFVSNNLQITALDKNAGEYHLDFRSVDGQTEAKLDVTDNGDGVLNMQDDYRLRVMKQKGDVRHEATLQHEEGFEQAFLFRNGHQQQVYTVFEGVPDSTETAGVAKVKAEIRKNFPGMK